MHSPGEGTQLYRLHKPFHPAREILLDLPLTLADRRPLDHAPQLRKEIRLPFRTTNAHVMRLKFKNLNKSQTKLRRSNPSADQKLHGT